MSTAEKEIFDAAPWRGKTKKYDFVQEGVIAVAVVAVLAIFLSLFFGSPDEPPLTFKVGRLVIQIISTPLQFRN